MKCRGCRTKCLDSDKECPACGRVLAAAARRSLVPVFAFTFALVGFLHFSATSRLPSPQSTVRIDWLEGSRACFWVCGYALAGMILGLLCDLGLRRR
jgi:hypothetical protein